MVNLILAVEGEFGITIPDRDMTPENFKSVLAIQSLLTSLQVGAPIFESAASGA